MEEFKVPDTPLCTVKAKQCNILDKEDNPSVKENKTAITKSINVDNIPSICPYKIPSWSTTPTTNFAYSFEVLKCGQIIEEIKDLQKKAFWTFGRSTENDIEMAHPTISRFHVILQYAPKQGEIEEIENSKECKTLTEGWYVYDLGSTHGTFLNKQRVPSKTYIRIRVGHILRLGASTRSYILQGPSIDEEPESELSVTELKATRQRQLEEKAAENQRIIVENEERAHNDGCTWGMSEDADAETDLTHNPYAVTNNEELFLDDPKKTLRGFFEREGVQLEYKCDELSVGSFVCRVELPIYDSNGRPIIAEVVHKGRKKECVFHCALEACRILDRNGVLRQAYQEPLKRKIISKSDSDEDDFLDRTGNIAKKRQRKANSHSQEALTHDDLLKQKQNLKEQLDQVQADIVAYQEHQKCSKMEAKEKNDDLDSYMEKLKNEVPLRDKFEIRKLRLDEQRLKREQERVQRLIELTKSVEFSIIKPKDNDNQSISSKTKLNMTQLPIIGKRNQFGKFKVISVEKHKTEGNNASLLASDEEEIDEDGNNIFNKINVKKTNEEDLDVSNASKETCKVYGPTLLPEMEAKEEHTQNEIASSERNEIENTKRRRQRIRHNRKRLEVDIDENDEHYDPKGKYVKWLPPDNQSGDGFTNLNKKYGY